MILGLIAATAGGLLWYLGGPDYRPSLRFAGSERCADCHPDQYQRWRASHHALAERPVDPALDRAAFDPGRAIEHGSVKSEIRTAGTADDARFLVRTLGADGNYHEYAVERVIGTDPLRQFLVRFSRGRWQVTALAYDPRSREWFDVFGDEDRKPHEWGFWANRGMTWNTMCATCHVTDFVKGYDVQTDSYRSRWQELAVGCEACHGPAADHVEWQERNGPARDDPTLLRLSKRGWIDTCGACHARRSSLIEPFRAGVPFLDQFLPVLPDLSDVYYPDGQVREENYEYTSFILSRMYHEGVTCMDCHDAHSGALLREGNNLCLKCHAGKIDPVRHSRHKLDGPGGQCVNCHMPITVYMQRDPRRDHGFTIPDPKLTIEYGIPNACNRCHEDKTAEWALAAVEEWYGDRMERITRHRAVAVARARRGDLTAIPQLLEFLREDPYPEWRAVFALCLRPWRTQPQVAAALLDAARSAQPIVQWAAARALDPEREPPPPLSELLRSPRRAVRVQAAWAMRKALAEDEVARVELEQFLALQLDQPTGCMMRGIYAKDRGQLAEAERWFRRALQFEPYSPVPWEAMAVMYSEAGQAARALKILEEACAALPREAHLHYLRGLALAELDRLPAAVAALEQAVRLDPDHTRAWYNLALARHRLGQKNLALRALRTALDLDPDNTDFTFAMATIYRDLNESERAIRWARRTLELNPLHRGAALLLEQLRQQPSTNR